MDPPPETETMEGGGNSERIKSGKRKKRKHEKSGIELLPPLINGSSTPHSFIVEDDIHTTSNDNEDEDLDNELMNSFIFEDEIPDPFHSSSNSRSHKDKDDDISIEEDDDVIFEQSTIRGIGGAGAVVSEFASSLHDLPAPDSRQKKYSAKMLKRANKRAIYQSTIRGFQSLNSRPSSNTPSSISMSIGSDDDVSEIEEEDLDGDLLEVRDMDDSNYYEEERRGKRKKEYMYTKETQRDIEEMEALLNHEFQKPYDPRSAQGFVFQGGRHSKDHLGRPVKTGKFSNEENSILMEAIGGYFTAQGWSFKEGWKYITPCGTRLADSPTSSSSRSTSLFSCPKGQLTRHSSPASSSSSSSGGGRLLVSKHWEQIGICLPGRSLRSIILHAYRTMYPWKTGPWSVEEEQQLISLVNQFGKKWTLISLEYLGRLPNLIQFKWKELQTKVNNYIELNKMNEGRESESIHGLSGDERENENPNVAQQLERGAGTRENIGTETREAGVLSLVKEGTKNDAELVKKAIETNHNESKRYYWKKEDDFELLKQIRLITGVPLPHSSIPWAHIQKAMPRFTASQLAWRYKKTLFPYVLEARFKGAHERVILRQLLRYIQRGLERGIIKDLSDVDMRRVVPFWYTSYHSHKLNYHIKNRCPLDLRKSGSFKDKINFLYQAEKCEERERRDIKRLARTFKALKEINGVELIPPECRELAEPFQVPVPPPVNLALSVDESFADTASSTPCCKSPNDQLNSTIQLPTPKKLSSSYKRPTSPNDVINNNPQLKNLVSVPLVVSKSKIKNVVPPGSRHIPRSYALYLQKKSQRKNKT